jgi:hypothetical protein
VDAFRIALVKEPKLLAKQKNIAKIVNYLSYYYPLTLKTILFILRKYADKDLKNHYIISKETSITNGKNIYMNRVCNHKEIN